jgi:hypothetical protein
MRKKSFVTEIVFLVGNCSKCVTKNVDEAQEFTEEVAICPEVVILEVGVEVVQQQLLLLPFL